MTNDQVINNGYVDRLYLKRHSTIPDRQDFVSNNKSFDYFDFCREYDSISFGYSINSSSGSYVDMPLTYYPGYVAYIDGNETEVSCGRTGVVRVSLPDGINEGKVIVKYKEKPIWIFADLVSLGSAILFLLLFEKSIHKRIQ